MKKNLKSVISFVIALGICASSATALAATTYTDVPADASYAEAVANLTAIGIVEGDGNGTFRPEDKITRKEVAAMVVRAMAQNDAAISSKGATNFTDVAAEDWASGYINVASRGSGAFINGMGDGRFAPEENVTYAQIVKMVVAAIGYGDWGIAAGGYPTGYIATAKQLGITDGVTGVNADDQVSRAVVAQLINNAIDTPLLALETYSPTDPEYVVMDGTDDNDYETVLTYYHDIYKVEGRVIGTHKSDSTIDADKVKYSIEVTKNYNDSEYVLKKSDNASVIEPMNIGLTDVADYLNVYSKLLVKVEEGEDPVVLSCVASGKNTTTTLQADAWDDEYYDTKDEALSNITQGKNKNQMWYYANSDKTGKSSRYYLDDEFSLYVNGVLVETTEENIETYIFNNETGTITLVDTPSVDSSSTDGRYDAVFVSYYATTTVDSVSSDKVYFDLMTNTDGRSYMEFDLDDEDFTWSMSMNGEKIDDFTTLQVGDVLNVAYDVVAGFQNSNFYEVLVSRDTAEGKLTEKEDDDKEIGIDGTVYKLASDELAGIDSFELGTSYTVYLDSFGKVVDFEKLASTVKYGIVNRFYYNDNDEEYKFSLYDTTATLKTFVVADNFKITDENGNSATYTTSNENPDLDTYAADGGSLHSKADSTTAANRVVQYTTNSSGEIKSIEFLSKTGSANEEYAAKSNKIGSIKYDDASVLISVDDTDFSVLNVSALSDESEYEAYGYDKDNGTYGFVVVTEGVGDYTVDARFAVVDKVVSSTNDDGDECEKLVLYTADSKEAVTVYTDSNDMFVGTDDALSKGDVIVYTTNANGEIEDVADVKVVFSAGSSYVNYAADSDYDKEVWYTDHTVNASGSLIKENPWTDNDDNEIEMYFGVVVDKSSSGISLATPLTDSEGSTVVYLEEDGSSSSNNFFELDYANDVNVIVYDFNQNSTNRLSVGATGSVVKANVGATYKKPDMSKIDADLKGADLEKAIKNADKVFLDVDAADADDVNLPYALVKVNEDDVTDVFVIIPKD